MVADPEPLVSVLLVTYNSAAYLERCLKSVFQQNHPNLEVLVVDNASSDSTREILSRSTPPVNMGFGVSFNSSNLGFAAAQNQAVRQAQGEWLLCLNPDVMLRLDFVSQLVSAARSAPAKAASRIGAVCGKLLRWAPGEEPELTSIVDSTGMYFTRNFRHLDRGAGEPDCGQYENREYLFGASGAAVLYYRAMVEDVMIENEFFDEDFFSYREDADLAWRAQILGWRCLYTPTALAWHVRRVTPERREQLPDFINWHSVKNRFLMRIKNCSVWLYARLLFPVVARDLVVFGYAALRNWQLFSALFYPVRHWARFMGKRRAIQSKRRVPDRALFHWFSDRPTGEPLSTRGD